MAQWILFFFLISSVQAAVSTGDGSDGHCVWSGSLSARTYQCKSLTVSAAGVSFSGDSSSGLYVLVQEDVFIYGNLRVDGGDGNTGRPDAGTYPIPGGQGGPGGYDGGACDTSQCSANAGSAPTGINAGGGGGIRGTDPFFSNVVGGGGGSGGIHNSVNPPVNGSVGTDNGGGTPGAGGSAPTQSYGAESNFQTTIQGGAGGGSGGGGDDSGTLAGGGTGGGGGGILRLYAGGNIFIDSGVTVSANGGAGGAGFYGGVPANGPSGGGGGGAGGSIYLLSLNQMINNGTISAQGGSGGVGATGMGGGNGGSGSAGGSGRIRLDDADGVIEGGGTVSPAPVIATSDLSFVFESEIETGCAKVAHESSMYWILAFVLGQLLLWAGAYQIQRCKS